MERRKKLSENARNLFFSNAIVRRIFLSLAPQRTHPFIEWQAISMEIDLVYVERFIHTIDSQSSMNNIVISKCQTRTQMLFHDSYYGLCSVVDRGICECIWCDTQGNIIIISWMFMPIQTGESTLNARGAQNNGYNHGGITFIYSILRVWVLRMCVHTTAESIRWWFPFPCYSHGAHIVNGVAKASCVCHTTNEAEHSQNAHGQQIQYHTQQCYPFGMVLWWSYNCTAQLHMHPVLLCSNNKNNYKNANNRMARPISLLIGLGAVQTQWSLCIH